MNEITTRIEVDQEAWQHFTDHGTRAVPFDIEAHGQRGRVVAYGPDWFALDQAIVIPEAAPRRYGPWWAWLLAAVVAYIAIGHVPGLWLKLVLLVVQLWCLGVLVRRASRAAKRAT